MTQTETQVSAPAQTPNDNRARGETLPAISGPRLPYHPLIEQRFGIDRASWKALVEAIFPNATSVESVILALSYCRARKLDPFKRNVHIVPIWNKQTRCMVDTIWPGIGELRTTAFRTGEYAGRGETTYGPDVTQKVGSATVTFPEWAQVTVKRVVKGQVVEFCGPRVYWLETYATVKRDDDTPNEMWATRPRGQIDKCAEAAALRSGFPEEIGTDYIPEEVEHPGKSIVVEGKAVQSLDDLTDKLEGPSPPQPAVTEEAAEKSPAETTDGKVDNLADADAGFRACTKLAEVGKWEAELLARPLTDEEKRRVDFMASQTREAIRQQNQSAKEGTQKELAR